MWCERVLRKTIITSLASLNLCLPAWRRPLAHLSNRITPVSRADQPLRTKSQKQQHYICILIFCVRIHVCAFPPALVHCVCVCLCVCCNTALPPCRVWHRKSPSSPQQSGKLSYGSSPAQVNKTLKSHIWLTNLKSGRNLKCLILNTHFTVCSRVSICNEG